MTSVGFIGLIEFIADLEHSNSNIKQYFVDPDMLASALKELRDMIGMLKLKKQILRQIKTFLSQKKRGKYKQDDMKHCLLLGPPGCGKTMVGKILCKVWISMGFIGREGKLNRKVSSFNKAQDELVRVQRQDIRDKEDKIKSCIAYVNNLNRVATTNKKIIHNIIKLKSQLPPSVTPILDELYCDASASNNIIDQNGKLIKKLMEKKQQVFKGFGIEYDKTLASTKDSDDLPFYVYKRNDVVSRYVGDTAHRCTLAMDKALDGVAYFDEAYNLCNDGTGFGDQYGREALTVINEYMSEKSEQLIVVFAGYKKDIYRNLFKVQEGLESRFTHKFEIEEYSFQELTKIYIIKLRKADYILNESTELQKIIKDGMDEKLFKYQGRDMETLAIFTRNVISDKEYDSMANGEEVGNIITDLSIVREAVNYFKSNKIGTNNVDNPTDQIDLRGLLDGLRA